MAQGGLDRAEPCYFGAGPAKVFTDVLQQAARDLIAFDEQDIGVGEISHRSKPAMNIIEETKQNVRTLLNVPDDYEIFFLQGGGTTGFSSIVYNMMASYAKKNGGKKGKAAYAVTGSWSKKSTEEAKRLGFDVDVVMDTKEYNYSAIPSYSQWKPIDKDSTAYLYICDNETVNGTEMSSAPGPDYLPDGVELVADMSSNFLSKEIDVRKYGLIMAGAQKNAGIAGLTVYIIKKSLLDQASDSELLANNIPVVPVAFHYPTVVKNNSAYNTIPIFNCRVLQLVTARLLKLGGLSAIAKINGYKSSKIYRTLEAYPSIYHIKVTDPTVRSRMNVVFTLPNSDLEAKFLSGASARKLNGLKGHRSVGGIRVSLYNAVDEESVNILADYIATFASSNA